MKKVASYTLSKSPDDREILLSEGEDFKTYLAFAEDYARFVGLKIYGRDLFPDVRLKKLLQERAEHIRAHFSSGIAFPLDVGEEDHRFFQVTELLPGHSLTQLIDKQGPLSPATAFELCKRILTEAKKVLENYDLKPNLAPDQVFVWRTGTSHWEIGFADYDLRPPKSGQEQPGELQLVQELSLLFYFIGTNDMQTWFYPMLNADYSEEKFPEIPTALLYLYQRAFDSDASKRPFSATDLRRLIDFSAEKITGKPNLEELPINRPFLDWMPTADGNFPEPYSPKNRSQEVGQPCTFEAVDKLRDTSSLVHILPPDAMTLSTFIDDYRQSMQLAQGKRSKVLTPIESVMCDPKCRVVAERPVPAISLASLLEQKEGVTRDEAITILEKISESLTELEKEGFRGASLQLNDIYLKPQGAKSRRAVMTQRKFGWLHAADKFQIFLRPFHSNLFYMETPDMTTLNGSAGKFGRSEAIRNVFRPGYEFATLAFSLMANAIETEDILMPKAMAETFRKTFSSRQIDGTRLRERFIDRLRRSLNGRPEVFDPSAPKLANLPSASLSADEKAERKQLAIGKVPLSAIGAAALLMVSVIAFFSTPAQQKATAAASLTPPESVATEPGVTPISLQPLKPTALAAAAPVIEPKALPTAKANDPAPTVSVPEEVVLIPIVEERAVVVPAPVVIPTAPPVEPQITEKPAPEVVAAPVERASEPVAMIEQAPVQASTPIQTPTAPPVEPEQPVDIAPTPEPAPTPLVAKRMTSATPVKTLEPVGNQAKPEVAEPEQMAATQVPQEEAPRIIEAEQVVGNTNDQPKYFSQVHSPATLEPKPVASDFSTGTADIIGNTLAAETSTDAGASLPMIDAPLANTDPSTTEQISMFAANAFQPGTSMDLESLAVDREEEKLKKQIAAARKDRESGKIGSAAHKMITLVEDFGDHEKVAEELDHVIDGIRQNEGTLQGNDRDNAEELVQFAAMNQNHTAVSLLATWADQNNSPTAVAWNQRAAEQGDPEAMARLGLYHSVGKHVQADADKAVTWFSRAAAHEQTDALYYLGECHFFGKGVERDPAKAVGYLTKAHMKGSSKASDMLATAYAKGEGVQTDHVKARSLYEEAIKRGNKIAFGNLGVLYLQNRGIEKNEKHALSLFERGAKADATNAMVFYALCHQRGVGTAPDPEKAKTWYVKAAKQGHPAAVQWCQQNSVEF